MTDSPWAAAVAAVGHDEECASLDVFAIDADLLRGGPILPGVSGPCDCTRYARIARGIDAVNVLACLQPEATLGQRITAFAEASR